MPPILRHVDEPPGTAHQRDGVDDQAERGELVLLALAIGLADLAATMRWCMACSPRGMVCAPSLGTLAGSSHRAAVCPRGHLAGTGRRQVAPASPQQAGPVQAVPAAALGAGLALLHCARPGQVQGRFSAISTWVQIAMANSSNATATAGSPAPQRPARNGPVERSGRRHGRQ